MLTLTYFCRKLFFPSDIDGSRLRVGLSKGVSKVVIRTVTVVEQNMIWFSAPRREDPIESWGSA